MTPILRLLYTIYENWEIRGTSCSISSSRVELSVSSSVYASKALDDLLQHRLMREENEQWIEKAIVIRVWLSTSGPSIGDSLQQLQQVFDAVLQDGGFSLSAPATHAAQTLIWKRIEETTTQEQHNMAETWCRLCLHPLFTKAGAQNKGKITRYSSRDTNYFCLPSLTS